MAPGQAKLTFAVSKVFSACNEPWNYCMPSKMAADEKPKEQVPQAQRAWKWNLKHKVSFLIRIMVKFRTKTRECTGPMSESRTGCDKADDEQLLAAWQAHPGSEEARWAQRLGWRSVMMMLRCSAAAKMDWPKLGLIKSQGWCCTSADIINIKMIMAEQFGSAEPNRFTPRVMLENICILTELSCKHIHIVGFAPTAMQFILQNTDFENMRVQTAKWTQFS